MILEPLLLELRKIGPSARALRAFLRLGTDLLLPYLGSGRALRVALRHEVSMRKLVHCMGKSPIFPRFGVLLIVLVGVLQIERLRDPQPGNSICVRSFKEPLELCKWNPFIPIKDPDGFTFDVFNGLSPCPP